MVIRTWCEELHGLNYLEDLDVNPYVVSYEGVSCSPGRCTCLITRPEEDFYELISVAMPEPWCVDVPLDRNVSAGNRDWRAVNLLNYQTFELKVDGIPTLGWFWIP